MRPNESFPWREYDKVARQYRQLAGEPRLVQAIREFNAANGKELTLEASPWFSAAGRRLKSWEEAVLTEEIPLRRGAGGLWMVSAMLNGRRAAKMAIDTGASAVTLPWKMAVAAGLEPGDNAETVLAQVAHGGGVKAKRVIPFAARGQVHGSESRLPRPPTRR